MIYRKISERLQFLFLYDLLEIKERNPMIHSDTLKLIRTLNPLLIGSSSYGIPCNDIDILISVKATDVPAVEANLMRLGFTRNKPAAPLIDPLVESSFSCGKFDIQIATPENYRKKRKAHEVILKQRLYVGKSKRQRYMLYKSLYNLM